MQAFPELVRRFTIPLARKKRWQSFCEIGSRNGDSADVILGSPGVSLTIIDPGLDSDLAQRYSTDPRVTVHKTISLEALPVVTTPFDCILIDGDHNWYTVYNELRLIRERNLLRAGGMIFFHDVSKPYGRRDMYYQPNLIPADFRQPYQQKNAATAKAAGQEEFDTSLCYADHEGGKKNGVLTAIEDFLNEHPGDYYFCRVRRLHGMGILGYSDRTLNYRLSFLFLAGKAFQFDSQAILNRVAKIFRWNKPVTPAESQQLTGRD